MKIVMHPFAHWFPSQFIVFLLVLGLDLPEKAITDHSRP